MIMRTFDLEAAKAGAPVCTRSGLEARIICYDRRGDSDCRMVALVNAGYEERVQYYSQAGKIIHNKTCADDLMMRDDDYAEKLARGEYGPTVKENLTVDAPTCKYSLPVDREYWRRVYAGQAMMGIFAGRNWRKDGAPDCIEHARNAVELADALIAELDKTNNNEK
jgi:hypothetical protein